MQISRFHPRFPASNFSPKKYVSLIMFSPHFFPPQKEYSRRLTTFTNATEDHRTRLKPLWIYHWNLENYVKINCSIRFVEVGKVENKFLQIKVLLNYAVPRFRFDTKFVLQPFQVVMHFPHFFAIQVPMAMPKPFCLDPASPLPQGMCGRAFEPRFLFSWPNQPMAH